MEQGIELIKNSLIRWLGGCTKKEFLTYKKTVYKHVKEMKLVKGLTEDEEIMLKQFREDKLLRAGKAKINNDRRNGA